MGSSATRISAQPALSDLENGDIIMRETIGFRSFVPIFVPKLLKRDALMFRKIGVLGCEAAINGNIQLPAEIVAELQWLIEQGVVFDLRISDLNKSDSVDDETKRLVGDWIRLEGHYQGKVEQIVKKMEEELAQEFKVDEYESTIRTIKALLGAAISSELFLRPFSAYYRNNKNIDAHPLFYGEYPELTQQTASTGEVIDNQLPVPDDSTAWEQIIDYRNDPDTEIKFRRFRVWMNEIVRAKLTPKEIEDKLEYLLDEYRQHMELHFKKTNTSTLETILVALGDRKFGDIVKIPFSVKHRQIALLEAEAKAPGREIAFISKAQETFHQ